MAGVGLGMTRLVPRRFIARALINVGVFFAVAAFLPQAPSYTYTGPVSLIINSRLHWEIAWLATFASMCATTGAVLLFSGGKQSSPGKAA